MVKDAEAHADDDRRLRQVADAEPAAEARTARGRAPTQGSGDKVDEGLRTEIEGEHRRGRTAAEAKTCRDRVRHADPDRRTASDVRGDYPKAERRQARRAPPGGVPGRRDGRGRRVRDRRRRRVVREPEPGERDDIAQFLARAACGRAPRSVRRIGGTPIRVPTQRRTPSPRGMCGRGMLLSSPRNGASDLELDVEPLPTHEQMGRAARRAGRRPRPARRAVSRGVRELRRRTERERVAVRPP